MKKFILLLLVFSCVFAFASCGKNDDGKALLTAESFVEVTGNAGSISLNEDVARTLLEVYPKKSLGLSKDIYEYTLKLSATKFLETDACLVEAFLGEAEEPESTFIILGQQCFVYNAKKDRYLLLTLDGAKEIATQVETTSATEEDTIPTVDEIEKQNNDNLQKLFKDYTKEELGLEKELSEYFLVATGTMLTAEDGETVFVVRLKDAEGKTTDKTLAINDNGNYMFDSEINKYKKLP